MARKVELTRLPVAVREGYREMGGRGRGICYVTMVIVDVL
jgi:hypothetical protein